MNRSALALLSLACLALAMPIYADGMSPSQQPGGGGGGGPGPAFDAVYLRLDTTNAPLTDTLDLKASCDAASQHLQNGDSGACFTDEIPNVLPPGFALYDGSGFAYLVAYGQTSTSSVIPPSVIASIPYRTAAVGAEETWIGAVGAAGAYSWFNDQNTGIAGGPAPGPGADTIQLKTAGTSRIQLGPTGRVGVNELAPVSRLSNTSTNILDQGADGVNESSIGWSMSEPGYVIAARNLDGNPGSHGVLVRGTSTSPLSRIFNVNIAGTDRFTITGDTNVTVQGNMRVQPGAASDPPYSFDGDPNIGMYRIGADNLGFAVAGLEALDIDLSRTQVNNTLQPGNNGALDLGATSLRWANGYFAASAFANRTLVQNGTAALPSMSFENDPDTGFSRVSSDEVTLSTSGAARIITGTKEIETTLPVQGPPGLLSEPAFAFRQDTDTGIYQPAPGVMSLVINSATELAILGTDTQTGNDFTPAADNTFDLGTPSRAFAEGYINDLTLANGTISGPTQSFSMQWGAKMDSTGEYMVFGGSSQDGKVSSLDPDSEGAAPFGGEMKAFAWNSNGAAASTVIKVLVNGVVQETFNLTGNSGSVTSLSTTISAGDLVAIEFDAGSNPDEMNATLYIEPT